MMPDVYNLRYTRIKCDHCDICLPYEWPITVAEPIIPRFINGRVDLEQLWLDERGCPHLPPATFSSCEPEEVLEGMGDLTEEEYDWLFNSDVAELPADDCWSNITDALQTILGDRQQSDHPLSCDFCMDDLVFDEPVMRLRHMMIDMPDRQPANFGAKGNDAKLSPLNEFRDDRLICLSCCYIISKDVISPRRDANGAMIDRPLWPML